MKAKGVIFDVDGSLYPFDRGGAQAFGESQLSQAIRQRVVRFFQKKFGISKRKAETLVNDLNFKSNGELSLWLEREFSIPRSEYFAETWDLDPRVFMDRDDELIVSIGEVAAKRSILSNAPRIWIDRVIAFLEIDHLFDPVAIFSGEPDVRKPHPDAFLQITQQMGLSPELIVSIGDQEESDILPAKSLGMRTVRIGRNVTTEADFVADDVPSAIKLLKKERIL